MSGLAKIDALCDEFEDSWSNNLRPDFSAWLARIETSLQAQLLEQLVAVDMELRNKSGNAIDPQHYAAHGSAIVSFAEQEQVKIEESQAFGQTIQPASDAELRNKSDNAIDPQHYAAHGSAVVSFAEQEQVEIEKSQAFGQTIQPTSDAKFLDSDLANSKKIGPYYLLEPIGEGGMGTVWKAEQREPVQRIVALKLIRTGLGSKEIIARFEAERQALTMMDHPSIAKVLDAGETDSGSPYFVMELVNGMAINEYCDQYKLGIRDRLALVIQVCNAVQHAHQKGIIHRDLKPSNVLVALHDGKPVAKVIDFGLAKALEQETRLTDKTMATEFGQVLGTLQYMSPEQAGLDSLDVDTRTDVYSLGVMLYELLTGSTPLEKESLADKALINLLQHICDSVPPKPSDRLSSTAVNTASAIAQQRKIAPTRLQTILRGELDWVVMKAIDKDRNRRYATATEFADDMQRFLNNEPVDARPPSASYRLMKFVAKNKVTVGAAGIVLAALVAGIAASTWFAIIATKNLDLAITARLESDQNLTRAVESEQVSIKETKRAVESERVAVEETNRSQKALASTSFVVANLRRKQGRVNEALKLLDGIPEEYRNVEWHLSRREMLGSDITLKAHSGSVNAIAVGVDRDWFASAGEDQRVVVWDVSTGKPRHEIKFGQPLADIAASPDGKFLAVAASGSFVSVIQFDTFEKVAELPTATFKSALTFSSDSTSVSFLDDQAGISHWKFGGPTIKSPDTTKAAIESSNDFLKLSDDGKQLHYSNQFGIYSVIRGTEQRKTLIADKMRTKKLPFAFSPNGSLLAHAENFGPMGREDRIRIVDMADNEVSTAESDRLSAKPIGEIQFSPDGNLIAAIRGNEIHTWSMTGGFGGYRQLSFIGHKASVNALAFATDGQRIISGSVDGTIKVWSRDNRQQAKLHLAATSLTTLVKSENPFEIVAGNGVSANRISTSPLRVREELSGTGFFPDANNTGWIALQSNEDVELEIVLINRKDHQQSTMVNTHHEESSEMKFSVDPTGRLAIVSSAILDPDEEDFQLSPTLYSLEAGEKLATLLDSSDTEGMDIGPILFSPNGKQAALGIQRLDDPPRLEVWDTQTLQRVVSLPLAEPALAFEFDTTGERIFVLQSKRILAWSTKNWKPSMARTLNAAHSSPSSNQEEFGLDIQLSKFALDSAAMRLHPAGNRLAVGIEDSILLVNLNSGEEVAEINAGEFIEDLQWSPDGALLFAAMVDGTLQVWNASEKDGSFKAEKSRIDPYWHANMADDAERRNEWFAAVFHRAWLLKHDPEHPLAWCLLQDAHENFQAKFAESDPPALPYSVTQMLELKKGESDLENIYFGLPDYEIVGDLESRLIDKTNWHASVRPRFERTVLKLIDDRGIYFPLALALMEFRLKNFDNAIKHSNEARNKRNRATGKESAPIELAILAMSHKSLGDNDEAEKFAELLNQAMKIEQHQSNENAKRIYAEFMGRESDLDPAERSKASRGQFGLPATVWPARVAQKSLVNNRGGGVF